MSATKLLASIIILIICVIYYFYKIDNSVYIKSTVDNKYYQVRDLPDKQEVADNLAYIKKNIQTLIDHMMHSQQESTSPEGFKSYIIKLNDKFSNVLISENIYDFYYTSYSLNKGEKLVFCMRSRKLSDNDKKHDINLMMYVALHEISHIACPEYGHTQKFKDIFKYITKNAIDLGIYTQIDFKNLPTEYCGLTIADSIV